MDVISSLAPPVESSRYQRAKRVTTELDKKGILSLGKIKKICGYTQNNTALDLAVRYAVLFPKFYCLNPIPKRVETLFEKEIESGISRKKAFKTEPIKLIK